MLQVLNSGRSARHGAEESVPLSNGDLLKGKLWDESTLAGVASDLIEILNDVGALPADAIRGAVLRARERLYLTRLCTKVLRCVAITLVGLKVEFELKAASTDAAVLKLTGHIRDLEVKLCHESAACAKATR